MMKMTCLVLGDINIDFSLQTPEYPPQGGRTHAERADFRLGGSGCLTALALHSLGCATALAGNLGEDMLGDGVAAQLRSAGLDTRFVRRLAGQTTGFFVIVTAPDGRPTTFGSRGANALLLPEKEILDGLTAFRHLHVSGYTLGGDGQFAVVQRMIEKARDTGLTVSLDPGVCYSPQACERILKLLIHTHYFLPNLEELSQLAGDLPLDDQVEFLLDHGCKAVALKLGERGSRYTDADRAVQQSALWDANAHIFSTNGAGDCFNAGFLRAILSGASPKDALQAGNAAAFRMITSPRGIQDWMPSA
jgi:sugar/nucleoside kinase (ribokinase family)